MNTKTDSKNYNDFVFFGTSKFSVLTLDTLTSLGFVPSLIITSPDRPSGRGQKISPPPVRLWAKEKSIDVLQPDNYQDPQTIKDIKERSPFNREWGLFVVASYGKILPSSIISIPKHNSLNIHPSLLPDLRGPSPIQEAILKRQRTGVTIIRMDDKMDHGPILIQKTLDCEDWPMDYPSLERKLAITGAHLLAEIIPSWIMGEIEERPQNDSRATYTKQIQKEDAFLDLENEEPEKLFRKIMAYKDRPRPYFFIETKNQSKLRVVVTEAEFKDGVLNILKIIPAGKKEIKYQDFQRNLRKS